MVDRHRAQRRQRRRWGLQRRLVAGSVGPRDGLLGHQFGHYDHQFHTDGADPGDKSGANITAINTSLTSLGQQLTDAVNGASFNGLNVLNGSITSTLQFVSGFNASATGGSFNTISFSAQALNGLATGGSSTSTTSQSTITDAPTIARYRPNTRPTPRDTTAPAGYGHLRQQHRLRGYDQGSLEVQSLALDGTQTTTTYTALDANGNTVATNSTLTFATAASLAVSTTVTTPGSQNLLTQNAIDLTNFQVGTGGNPSASAALTAANQALSAITNYAAVIGATQDRMTTANTFNTALMTDYKNGVAGMVDADMNTASTQLQALQTQEQLGIQSLSIANQNAGLVLKLFAVRSALRARANRPSPAAVRTFEHRQEFPARRLPAPGKPLLPKRRAGSQPLR